jgi:hypothetical protein
MFFKRRSFIVASASFDLLKKGETVYIQMSLFCLALSLCNSISCLWLFLISQTSAFLGPAAAYDLFPLSYSKACKFSRRQVYSARNIKRIAAAAAALLLEQPASDPQSHLAAQSASSCD